MQPQYQKIKQYILDRIDTGLWTTGQKTVSENALATQFRVSRMTANRALKELTSEGFLTRVAGVGTFVAEQIPQSPLFEIKNIADEIRARGHHYSATLQLLRSEKAAAEIARELEIPTGARVFHSIVVHHENEIPVQLEDRYVSVTSAPHYIEQDFERITPNEYLMKTAPLSEAEHIIEAILPDRQAQKLLNINATEPCILLHRRTWSGATIASSARLIHPGSRYRLGGRFIPDQMNRQAQ